MDAVSDNSGESNPIYHRLIAYDLIRKVFQRIESLDDPGLQVSRMEVKSIYERITTRYVRRGVLSPPVEDTRALSEWRQLCPEQLVAFSQQVFEDVCQFVLAVTSFYRIVRSCRPLTKEEKEDGNSLRELLNSVQEFIPARPSSSGDKV